MEGGGEEEELCAPCLGALPTECLVHVLSYLPVADALRLTHVCREWRRLLCDPVAWKRR